MIMIDKNSKTPVYIQLYHSLKDDIVHNKKKGTKLPSIRAMAKQLGVSINTVDKAYQQLVVEGYVFSIVGSGYYCNEVEHGIYEGGQTQVQSVVATTKVAYDFISGSRDNREFPWNNWKKCVKEALLREELEAILKYSDKQGRYSLRCTLAAHLKETRGVICEPEQIVICAGLQNSVDIISAILPPSQYHLGFEEPGFDAARLSFYRNGYKITPIPIDADGLSLATLMETDCNLVYVTPSHQFPTGIVMPVARRQKLINAIHEKNGYIIEDDYDSEFRYGTLSIPSLQSLSRSDRVIYLGTLSKSLSPTIRFSYIVLPTRLLPEYNHLFQRSKSAVSDLIQLAVEEFFEQGFYARHLRKLILINEERYKAAISAFEQEACPYITLSTSNSGLHLLLQIETKQTSAEILQQLEEKGVRIYSASNYWIDDRKRNDKLFLFGFANYQPKEIYQGVKILCDTVNSMNR